MGFKRPRRRIARRAKIEALEDRQMFSADPLGGLLGGSIEQHAISTPDFWYDGDLLNDLDPQLGDIQQTLASAHNLTGLDQARQDFGFTGAGQTVAVIDSGIAYDHYALGGGFGANYRVVGGWDFTEENDANPYDDGPSGSHGTHVAGIIGATANSSGDVGVAPGVDLVGLRVFNDQGAGYFSWVENALRWVHTNRSAFENPITAINLSLGTSWNAATVPSWAMLEDEFSQLEADGIFIAVSAGNSFTTYNAPGLSYPAASSHVVPVMSVDDSGSLSYFSQRHSRAIAAPGRSIRSTVPDYVGNQNGVTDDWANYSGTSMAAPYVAGASVIIREAMEFVGLANITEWSIYNHMTSTADTFFDSATNQSYKRLNMENAISALMPTDDYGSTVATAYNLGTIGSAGTGVSGLIGKRDDVDYFRFTAAATGTVTFIAETTYYLDAVWTGGGTVSGVDGNIYTIDVVAGQSYAVGLSTSDGLGYFNLTISAESAFTFVDWGTVEQTQINNSANNGESWYRVTASQAGYLTAEALFDSAGGSVDLAWYDADLQLVATGSATSGGDRVDWLAGAGEQLYLHVTGANADVDFRVTNLVSQTGTTVNVTGTGQDDTFAYTGGSEPTVSVNGVSYDFDADAISSIVVDGGAGTDSLTIKTASVAIVRASGVETVTDLDARALALDRDLGLSYSKSYYQNWAGFDEKWILGNTTWYFVTPDGALHRWTGGSTVEANPLVAQFDASYYVDPGLIHDARVTMETLDQQLIHQVADMGLHLHGSYYTNWGGMNEKWVLSNARQWYFVTPDGTLYQWAGGEGVAGSTVVTQVGTSFHDDPSMLHDASMLGSFSAQIAYDLDTTFGLHYAGTYATNWGGQGEKWIRGTANDWYYITPSGGFYQWNGARNLAGSRLLAALDVSYYATPSRLHDSVAPLASTSTVQSAAFAQLGGGVTADAAGAESNSAAAFGSYATVQPQAGVSRRAIAHDMAAGRALGPVVGDWTTLLDVVRRNREVHADRTDEAARHWAAYSDAGSLADRFEGLFDVTSDDQLASIQLAFAELSGAPD
jgi:subtilisin family serine protease